VPGPTPATIAHAFCDAIASELEVERSPNVSLRTSLLSRWCTAVVIQLRRRGLSEIQRDKRALLPHEGRPPNSAQHSDASTLTQALFGRSLSAIDPQNDVLGPLTNSLGAQRGLISNPCALAPQLGETASLRAASNI